MMVLDDRWSRDGGAPDADSKSPAKDLLVVMCSSTDTSSCGDRSSSCVLISHIRPWIDGMLSEKVLPLSGA